MPKVKIIEPGEIVTPPTPLPIPDPTYEEGNAQDYELWQNKEEQGE